MNKFENKFRKKLNDLFESRIHWLKSDIMKMNPGKPPVFTKKTVDKTVSELQEIAFYIKRKRYNVIFNNIVRQKKQWHTKKGKGWSRDAKIESFTNWFLKNIKFKNYIYIFWDKKKCKYVGRSINGVGRPQNHFKLYWFSYITRIDIYATKKRTDVPRIESLAYYLFKPKENYYKPSIPKWAKACPIRETDNNIRYEVKKIFNLR
jgi:hypothetical protein